MTLGQRIQQLRKENGLSQEALGEQLGVSRQAISKWESDITIPEIDKLIALSRLFHVSVGILLGVEENDPTAPPAGELTDRELLAVEAIVERYLSKAQQQKPTRKIWPFFVTLAALLILVFWFKGQLETLNGRLSNLQNNMNQIDSSVSHQIDSVTNQIEALLKEESSLLADCDFEITAVDIPSDSAVLDIRVTPKNYSEDMELVFTVESWGSGTVTASGLPDGRSFYIRDWPVPLSDEIKLSVSLGTDGAWQTQSLETLNNLSSDTILVAETDLRETSQLTTHDGAAYWLSLQKVSGYFLHKSDASLLADVTAVTAQLELHKNGECIERIPLTLHPTEDAVQRFSCAEFETNTPVQNGDQLMYLLVFGDNYGRTTYQELEGVGFSSTPDGTLDFIRIAPADSAVSYSYTIAG